MRTLRFWTAVGLMLATSVILHLRGDKDTIPLSRPLDQFPETLQTWQGTDVPLDQGVLDVLGKGVFLNRFYESAPAGAPAHTTLPVQLFIGYFPTQRTGQSIHSPQHCLPGAGWVFQSSATQTLASPGIPPIVVSDYVISDGNAKAEVLYWYRSHGRSIAGDYEAKLYTLYDSLRFGRTDAALVRVLTPIGASESPASAHNRLVGFATQLNSLLQPYIPD